MPVLKDPKTLNKKTMIEKIEFFLNDLVCLQ